MARSAMVPQPLRKAISKLGALLERQGLAPDLHARLRRVAQHLNLVVADTSVAAQVEALAAADAELQDCLAAADSKAVNPATQKELGKVAGLVAMLTRPATGEPAPTGRPRGKERAAPLPPTMVLPSDDAMARARLTSAPVPPPAAFPPRTALSPPSGPVDPGSPVGPNFPVSDASVAAAILRIPPTPATPFPATPPDQATRADTEPGAPTAATEPVHTVSLVHERHYPSRQRRRWERRYDLLILTELNGLADALRRLRTQDGSPERLQKVQLRCLHALYPLRWRAQEMVRAAWEYATTEMRYPEDVCAPALVLASVPTTVDDRTERWLAALGDEQKQALAAVGFDELVARLRSPDVFGSGPARGSQ